MTAPGRVVGSSAIASVQSPANEAFYIHSLARPGAKLTVEAPVPIRSGDKVTMLGHDRPLVWTVSNGSLVIDVPESARGAGRYVWVFKVDWQG